MTSSMVHTALHSQNCVQHETFTVHTATQSSHSSISHLMAQAHTMLSINV